MIGVSSFSGVARAAFGACALLVASALCASATEVKVTFLITNDIYKLEGSGKRGGFARLAGVVEAERAKGGNLIYAHAGDTMSPSLMSSFDQGKHVIDLLNIVPPDVFVPGNHEFDFGPEIFMVRMKEAKFPIYAANLGDDVGAPFPEFITDKIVEFEGVKIGLVGLAADDSPVKSSPGGLKFAPSVQAGITAATKLRSEGADLVVTIAHTNRAQDRALFESRAFDVILSGDDHDLALWYDGKTVLVESKEEAEFVTAVDVTVDVQEKDGKRTLTWWPNFRIIDTAEVTPSAKVAERTRYYEDRLSKELDVEIGITETELDSRKATVRGEEAAIGNLIADAMRDSVGADVAITNGGGIRGNKQIAAGSKLTRRDVLTELPFGNRTVLIAVKGATILAALENGLSQVEQGGGRFPQVSGLIVRADLKKPAGSRVHSVLVAGQPLDNAATYKLATNDFMLRGGDGYVMLKDGAILFGERDGRLIADEVMSYIAKARSVAPKPEGRVEFMP